MRPDSFRSFLDSRSWNSELRRRSPEIMAKMIRKLKDLATYVLEEDVEMERIRRPKLVDGRIIASAVIIVASMFLIRYSFGSGYVDAIEILAPIILLILIWQEDSRNHPYRLACRQSIKYLNATNRPEGYARFTDLTKIAGTAAAAQPWISVLVEHGVWSESLQDDGSRSYALTDFGSRLYRTLRDPNARRVLIRHTSGT